MYNLIMEGFFMSKNNMKISKGYSIMWIVFTAIYAVWMCFFGSMSIVGVKNPKK